MYYVQWSQVMLVVFARQCTHVHVTHVQMQILLKINNGVITMENLLRC